MLRSDDQCAFVDGFLAFHPIEPAYLSALASGYPRSENGSGATNDREQQRTRWEPEKAQLDEVQLLMDHLVPVSVRLYDTFKGTETGFLLGRRR